MKILITGYTSRMVKASKIRGDYATFSNILPNILRDMGHEVDQKVVTIGEEIAGVYNYAFCGISPLGSLTSAKVPETHYALDQMQGRCALFADDWSFCSFGGSARYALQRWEKYCAFKRFPYDSDTLDKAKSNLERIAYNALSGNNPPILAPMFKWGNHEFLLNDNITAELVTIDPSAWIKFPTVATYDKEDKKKQWVSAALSDHSHWIKRNNFSFPILHVGNKRLGPIYNEDGVVQLFAESFGAISVGYKSAGSGWWRTRYLNAVWAETIIYCDERDQVTMGEAYQGLPSTFEKELNTSAYDDRVLGQKEFMDSNISPKEEVINTLEVLLNS